MILLNKTNTLATQKTIRIKGSLLDLSTPLVMGVINLTPDSFYAESRKSNTSLILEIASQMLQDGADILDIGGYSSRPGATPISVEEELNRVIHPIKMIKTTFPGCVISVDTFRSEVARQAIDSGASIVNDISGGELDPDMFQAVAFLQVPYILMHMRGNPETMTSQNHYEDLTRDILKELSVKLEKLEALGIHDIIVDPGFGFAKNMEQNFQLLNELEFFKWLEKPLLVGLSRKSMIHKTLGSTPDEALNGTTVANTVALLKGANILRVHDVKEAKEAVVLISKLKN